MGKYNTLSFQKSSIIYIKNQYPKDSFYVITKGKAISYGTFDYNIEFNKGNILGLVNAVLNEPYFYNVKAVEDTEVMEIKIEDIVNIESKDLMVKIDRYLDTSLEMWLSKYYMSLSNNHNNSIFISSKDDVLKMAEVYKKNGFDDASYKLYKKCIELFPESENEIKNQLSSLTPISEPTAMGNNTFSYKKGYCIYTELEASNKLYIIQSGKVGIYNIINSHQKLPEQFIQKVILLTDINL
ncbi:cyclic nucleotide-binding domain-containing protein [uncultured Brachyspira sp.]|uniref:cyclic nucleotide-binding domain-containing protein n=1 Tax=uncultured Brachyspira sp. TaxID=221953 RepID=UPI00262CA488|nr:cyclic nucleotide-binding domain-containing protein [uncultured Brachyspira sp.]